MLEKIKNNPLSMINTILLVTILIVVLDVSDELGYKMESGELDNMENMIDYLYRAS